MIQVGYTNRNHHHLVTHHFHPSFVAKMEQYLLQLPKRLAQEVRAGIAAGEATADIEMISGGAYSRCPRRTLLLGGSWLMVLGCSWVAADNKHFTLAVNGKEYPAKIGASLLFKCRRVCERAGCKSFDLVIVH